MAGVDDTALRADNYTMSNLVRFGFFPRSYDFALLVLRIWFGAGLLLNHGLQKLTHYSRMSAHFPDPLHIGSQFSLILVLLAEVVGSILLIIGFATRWAALVILIELAVALTLVHKFAFSGPMSGELAYAYFGGVLVIFLAGAGRFSVDRV